jgi:hypothetical protein
MESSTVLAFRIFVMLSCLIIVPMAAIFGSAFPDVVKSVLVDRIVAWSTGKPVESSRSAAPAAGFREVTPQASAVASRDGGTSVQAPPWNAGQADAASWQSPGASAGSSGVVPVGGAVSRDEYNQSASFVAPGGAPAAYSSAERSPEAPQESPYHRGSAGPAAGAQEPPHAAGPDSAPPADRVACPLEPPERFTEMERKLREYGATYYLLETWGKDGELYRFHCRMAVGNNPNYTRHFEASNRDALKAMSEVLQRVEGWRAGRLQ